MKDNFALLDTLDGLFSGARTSVLTLDELLAGLSGRSFAFAILALNLPNCIPTGIPWLSTITGVPMVILLLQQMTGRTVPTLPRVIGRRGLPRGKLQDFLARSANVIRRLERSVHARHEWAVRGLARRLLLGGWTLAIVILALPIPFDNLFPAWAVLFFCLALIEDDGLMAMLGWLATLVTLAWTAFLLAVGHTAATSVLSTLSGYLFD
ncbi:MAG: exopolysaccharide biosynthesis protein [Reyranellaceae bacterium]